MLVERHNNQGLKISIEKLIIITASQQALDLISMAFPDQGD
jgi:DNA-binding transcriptional MocR family regulator